MSAKGDFLAARTRNQLGSEGIENDDPIELKASQNSSECSKESKTTKETGRKRTTSKKAKGKKSQPVIPPSQEKQQPIAKFLENNFLSGSGANKLRAQSASGPFYSPTSVVNRSESECDTLAKSEQQRECELEYPNFPNSDNRDSHTQRRRDLSRKLFTRDMSNSNVFDSESESATDVNGSIDPIVDEHDTSPVIGANCRIAIRANGSDIEKEGPSIKVSQSLTAVTTTIVSSRQSLNSLTNTCVMATTTGVSSTIAGSTKEPSIGDKRGRKYQQPHQSAANQLCYSDMGTRMIDQHMLYNGQQTIPFEAAKEPLTREYVNLNGILTSVQSQVLQHGSSITETNSRMDGLEFEQERDHATIQDNNKRLRELEDRCKLMSNIIKKNDVEIQLLRRKAQRQDSQHICSSVKLVGVEVPEDKSLMETVNDFFANVMKISTTIKIANVSQLKSGKPTHIVMRLAEKSQKKLIFEHSKNLKNLKNKDGKYINVYSMLADEEMEVDLRKRQFVQANYNLPVAQRQKIMLKKGKLTVNGSEYRPKYEKLSTSDLLDISIEDMKDCQKVKVSASKSVQEK